MMKAWLQYVAGEELACGSSRPARVSRLVEGAKVRLHSREQGWLSAPQSAWATHHIAHMASVTW